MAELPQMTLVSRGLTVPGICGFIYLRTNKKSEMSQPLQLGARMYRDGDARGGG
jgi:hypothetical protein